MVKNFPVSFDGTFLPPPLSADSIGSGKFRGVCFMKGVCELHLHISLSCKSQSWTFPFIFHTPTDPCIFPTLVTLQYFL